MAFTHLHVHTEFSPKDAIAKIDRIAAKVATDGQSALAITDHGSLGGTWELKHAAARHGITPIAGCEMYLALTYPTTGENGTVTWADRHENHTIEVAETVGSTDADAGAGATKTIRYHHLTVLARNRTGWKNLVRLHNRSHEIDKGKNRIDYQMLAQHSDGLIVLTGCLGGPLQRPLQSGDREQARTNLQLLIDAVGRDSIAIEVMYHGIDGELQILEELYQLAEEYSLPCVATGDSHCVEPHEQHAQEVWLAIGTGKRMSDPTRWSFNGTGYHVKTEAEMRAIFPNDPRWQAACDMSAQIAAVIDPDAIPGAERRLPVFPTPPGFTSSSDFFEYLVFEGAQKIYGEALTPEQTERLMREIDVIEAKGFPDYFLIVRDVVLWCASDYTAEDWITVTSGGRVDETVRERKKPILTGPGRGSAAGSVVSYVLGITKGLDPLAYDLLFERFLNPDSQRMPDIDVDFEKARRGEVIAYLRHRWGADRVAQIGTYAGTLTKAAINNSARALEEQADGAALSALVPMKGPTPYPLKTILDESFPEGAEFRARAASTSGAQRILDIATVIEGVHGPSSVHASAVLISSEPLVDLIPMRRTTVDAGGVKEHAWITEWVGEEIEDFGMLKFDVLGIRNLDVIHNAIDLIAEDGHRVDLAAIDPNDLDDPRVHAAWQTLAAGRTANLFQLDGEGMTSLLTAALERVPTGAYRPHLEDLTSVIALYRPGPMGQGMHTQWAAIKAGHATASYDWATSEPSEQAELATVLGATEGVITYQEQLMRLAERLAGFGPYARSALQKAVSKKKMEILAELEPLFISGGQFTAGDGSIEQVPGGTAQFTREDDSVSPAFASSTLHALWATFRASGEYLFNKSHSAAYALVGFWTAYLKASWPREFAAAVLVNSDKEAHRTSMLRELRSDGIEVIGPDVLRADVHTRVIDGAIVYGLQEVKGLAAASARKIVAARTGAREDWSFEQIAQHLIGAKVPARDVELLVWAGGMDRFGTRREMTRQVRGIIRPSASGRSAPRLPAASGGAEWSAMECSVRERERIQVVLGDHPLTDPGIVAQLAVFRPATLADVVPVHRLSAAEAFLGSSVQGWYAGVMVDRRDLEGRTGRFTIGALEDGDTQLTVTVWPEVRRLFEQQLPSVGDLVVVQGQANLRQKTGDLQLDVGEIRRFDPRSAPVVPQVALVSLDDALAGAERLLAPGQGELKVSRQKRALGAPVSLSDIPKPAPTVRHPVSGVSYGEVAGKEDEDGDEEELPPQPPAWMIGVDEIRDGKHLLQTADVVLYGMWRVEVDDGHEVPIPHWLEAYGSYPTDVDPDLVVEAAEECDGLRWARVRPSHYLDEAGVDGLMRRAMVLRESPWDAVEVRRKTLQGKKKDSLDPSLLLEGMSVDDL